MTRWPTSAVPRSPGLSALRPQALPTDMSVRFLLLLAAVAAASLYMFEALWFVLRGEAFIDVVRGCGLGVDAAAAGSITDTSAVLQAQAACRSRISREQSLFALAGVALVFVVAYAGYRLLPRWRERRSHLEPLDPVDGAALQAELDRLCREAGLTQKPPVLVDSLNSGVQAFVYGTRGRPRLGVTGGLVVQQVLDPPGFRAVLRHELAHLGNRDVPWTYFTVTAWWSFVAVGLVPVVVVLAVSDPQYVLRLGWRTAVLALVVLLVRNSVLRAREVYADARAAEAAGSRDLDRVLAGQPAPATRRLRSLRRHPSAMERRGLLADPDGTFRADGFTALAAGLTSGAAFPSLRSITSLVAPAWAAAWLAGLLVGAPLAGVVCVAAWRCALLSAARRVPVPVAGALTAGVGLGLAVGPVLSFDAAAGGLVSGLQSIAGYVVWALGTVAVVGLVARYAADAGRTAIDAELRSPQPWRALSPHAVAVVAALAAALAFGHLTLILLTSFGLGPAMSSWEWWAFLPYELGPGDNAVPAMLVVGLLVAAPLVAGVMLRAAARQPGRIGSWPWRGAPPDDVPVPAPPTLHPVLLAGACAGAVAVLAHVLARLAGAWLLDEDVWRSDTYRLSLGGGTVALLAATAVIAAAAGALATPRRWWPLGILGGAAGLAIGSAGVLAANMAAGCGLLPRAGPRDCRPVRLGELVSFGWQPAGYAVLGIAMAAAVVGAIRSLTEAGSDGADSAGRGRLVGATLLAVALAGIAGAGLVLRVAATDLDRVVGPGYEIALPPLWQATEVPGEPPLLVTINQKVRVSLAPIPAPLPPQGGPTLDVGGVEAWFVGRQAEGLLELRAFDLVGPAGSYRLVLLGTPDALDAAATKELPDLLAGIGWTSG